jgi:hypothetical protein
MIAIQIKYQREIDRLEKELQSLKKQLLLKQDRNLSGKKQRKIKVCFSKIYQTLILLFFFSFSRDHLLICIVKY